MKFFRSIALFLAASITAALSAFSVAAAQVEPYPLDYFAVRAQMSGVALSPDGKYVAFQQILSKEGNPVIRIFNTNDLSKPMRTIGGDSMEVTGFNWVDETAMIVSFRAQVSDKIGGFNRGAYRGRLALYNVAKDKFTKMSDNTSKTGFSMSLVNVLPHEQGKVLINLREGGENKAFRSNYYKLNIKTLSKSLVLKGNDDIRSIRFDSHGNPRTAVRFFPATDELSFLYRKPGEKSWAEIKRFPLATFEQFDILAFDETNPAHIYVRAHNGQDKAALWFYNTDSKSFESRLYSHPVSEVSGLRYHSNFWTNPDTVVGVGYFTDKSHIVYFDTQEAAIEEATYAQLEGLVPHANQPRITSRSKDGQSLVVLNRGPKDPGSYYLLANGKFQYLGGRYPLLKTENLAEVRYINYPSRDGRNIPAYVTVPQGKPPFPLVVMPHGGPFVRETVVYDEWAQMLANNGYMVLQPQYRGSRGYGLDFYKAAFIERGEGGYKMQDDKDDGALYLVQQGLVDRDRLGFFGWSYGGYAALIAAARPNNIYQCSIAGAAVTDNQLQVNYYRNQLRGASKTEQIKFWDESISPIDQADQVNIPLLIIHGSIDQRVPPEHAKRYTKELDKYGIPYEYLELDGADHFYNTLFYRHKIEFFTKMIDFFKNDCGPGGL
jgi:dipeptidyl aminopeptidase/acylaminoacyl peptidase